MKLESPSKLKENGGKPRGSSGKVGIFTFKGRRNLPSALYYLLGFSVMLLRRTMRVSVHDPHRVLEWGSEKPVIISVWHNRLLFMPVLFPRNWRYRTGVLASDSRDGEYAAKYMLFFGFHSIRGSSSKGGARALRLLKQHLDSGCSVGLTPDGPRGPRYRVQPGVVALSQLTGSPIVPVSINASRRWQLKGWDRTQIPKPFSRVELVIGQPLIVPSACRAADRQTWLERTQAAMESITFD